MRLCLLTLAAVAVLMAGCSTEAVDGPVPNVTEIVKQDPTDENPGTAWNGAATPVTVTGARFTPMAADTLTGKPKVKIPSLYLVNATSSTRLRNVVWIDSQTISGEIPSGIDVGTDPGWMDFRVVAVDPSGKRGVPGASFRISSFEPPKVTGAAVAGTSAVKEFCGVAETPNAFDVMIAGEKFQPDATARFRLRVTDASKPASAVTATVTSATEKSLVMTIPAGQAAGVYDVVITNPDGQQNTLKSAFSIVFDAEGCTMIASVSPRFAYRNEDVLLEVQGGGFVPTPALTLIGPGSFSVDVSYETYVTETTTRGLLYRDAARSVGWYDLKLENPDGSNVAVTSAILVVDQPLPRIDSVSPESFKANKTVTVSVRGDHFPAGTTVQVFSQTFSHVPPIVSVTTQQVDFTFAAGTVSGAQINQPLLVRVYAPMTVNGKAEVVYSEYSSMVVVESSGNNDAPIQASSKLVTPRREFGLVGSRDPIGQRFLYAVGGRTSGTSNAALATVEVAAIDRFGNLLPFYESPVTLGVAGRYGLGLLAHEGWLYAVGGSTSTGPVTTVVKAKILDPRDRPLITAANSVSGGGLTTGIWFYEVSAVVPTPDNPGGESLPSIEIGVLAVESSSVTLTWRAVSGATQYRVYRTSSANLPPGSERLLASVSACAPCDYTDTGGNTTAALPLPSGAVGTWIPGGWLETDRVSHAVTIARNRFGEPFAYAFGGVDQSLTVLNTYEKARIATGGNIVFSEAATAFTTARHGAGIAVLQKSNIDPVIWEADDDADWVTLASGASNLAGTTWPNSAENSRVLDDGALGSFATFDKNIARSFGGAALYASGEFFQIGGLGTGGQPGSINAASTLTLVPPDTITLGAFSNNPGLGLGRWFFGYTRFNAQVFVVGGATAGGVTDTVEYFFY